MHACGGRFSSDGGNRFVSVGDKNGKNAEKPTKNARGLFACVRNNIIKVGKILKNLRKGVKKVDRSFIIV